MPTPTQSRESTEEQNRRDQRDPLGQNIENSTLKKRYRIITRPIIFDLTGSSPTASTNNRN